MGSFHSFVLPNGRTLLILINYFSFQSLEMQSLVEGGEVRIVKVSNRRKLGTVSCVIEEQINFLCLCSCVDARNAGVSHPFSNRKL